MDLSNVIIGKTQFFINMYMHISSCVYNVFGIRRLLIPSLLSASSPSNDNRANDYDDNKEGAQCCSYNYRNRDAVIMMW